MKRRLRFRHTKTLRSIIAHSLAHPRCKVPYTSRHLNGPALLLVHDDGVYLMSASVEPQLVEHNSERRVVSYADGCRPSDEDCWEHSRELVGGDDFSELLPLEPTASAKVSALVVDISETEIIMREVSR